MRTKTLLTSAVILMGLVALLPCYGQRGIGKRLFPPAKNPDATASVLPPMPAAARQTILGEAALAEIEDCERTTEDGEFVYEVNYLRGGVARAFTVAPDGTLRSRQVFRKELPPAVQQAVNALETRGILGDIYWCDEDGDLVYEAEVGVGEDKRHYTLLLDGTHLATERLLEELPAAAQQTIRAQAGNAPLLALARDETEVGDVFDAVTLRNGTRHVVSVNAAGAVVATQILLVQASAEVQDTIARTAGSARIVYVGQCAEDSGFVFDVIAFQGTARREFVVDAAGKLISQVVALSALPEAVRKALLDKAGEARIARIERLVDGTFEADLDRRGKKQTLAFSADGAAR